MGISNSIKANLEPWELPPTDELTTCIDCTEELCSAYFDNLATQSLSRLMRFADPSTTVSDLFQTDKCRSEDQVCQQLNAWCGRPIC
jgi:hypothetical protein